MLSLSMSVLSGLFLIKQNGYLPLDPALFNQMTSSLICGLVHQDTSACATFFVAQERRELLVSHLPA